MSPSSNRALWIAVLAVGGVAVVGTAVALSSSPAVAATNPSTTPTTPNVPTTPSVNPGALPGATTPVTATPGLTTTQTQTLVQSAQNALANIASSGKVPNLSYTLAQATAANGNSADSTFVAQLAVFQAWVNAQGGVTLAGATVKTQLNTAGTLDYATLGALMAQAAGQAI